MSLFRGSSSCKNMRAHISQQPLWQRRTSGRLLTACLPSAGTAFYFARLLPASRLRSIAGSVAKLRRNRQAGFGPSGRRSPGGQGAHRAIVLRHHERGRMPRLALRPTWLRVTPAPRRPPRIADHQPTCGRAYGFLSGPAGSRSRRCRPGGRARSTTLGVASSARRAGQSGAAPVGARYSLRKGEGEGVFDCILV